MKEKNLPDDNISISLDELTKDVDLIVQELEKEKDLGNSMDKYQKLLKLNNIIEKKFQKKSREINELTKNQINKINKKIQK
jgi:hypothetical protein